MAEPSTDSVTTQTPTAMPSEDILRSVLLKERQRGVFFRVLRSTVFSLLVVAAVAVPSAADRPTNSMAAFLSASDKPRDNIVARFIASDLPSRALIICNTSPEPNANPRFFNCFS